MCLDAVKMYGNSPRKLFIRIKRKMETNIVVLPTNEVGPNNVLNSLCNLFIIIFIVTENFPGITQNEGIKIIINRMELTQFIE